MHSDSTREQLHKALTSVPPPKAPEAEGSRDRLRMLCWLSSSAVWEAVVKGEADPEPVGACWMSHGSKAAGLFGVEAAVDGCEIARSTAWGWGC